MPVPEAAVNQYHAAPAAHYDIGPAWKPAPMQAVANPQTAKNAPHGPLRARVPATDGRHVGAAPLTADPVHFSPWIACPALVGPSSCAVAQVSYATHTSLSIPASFVH